MKQTELHQLIKQNIPNITFLETETTEVAEGECTVWEQDDCTLIIEFENKNLPNQEITTALQTIAQKLAHLDAHRKTITQTLAQATQTTLQPAQMVYVAFFVEDAQNVFCDFAVSAPTWGERVAECSLEEDNELIFNELNKI